MDQALNKNDRDWAMYGHAAGLLSLTGFPFAHIIGPLVVYLKTRDESAFSAANARASLNFQITQTLVALVLIGVGFILMRAAFASRHPLHDQRSALVAAGTTFFAVLVPLFIVNVVSCIRGAVAASKGEPFTYPFSIELVR